MFAQNPPPGSTPARLASEMQQSNPANAPEKVARKRIPLGLPTLKLNVPEIPGFKCYWFRGTPQRLQQAYDAGYLHVDRGEVHLTQAGLASDAEADGNTDLGSRVSVGDQDGIRLFLMKIPSELWAEDEQAIEAHHETIASQIRGDKGLELPGQDRSKNYSRGESRNLFTPRRA